jgi:hypothetical protein
MHLNIHLKLPPGRAGRLNQMNNLGVFMGGLEGSNGPAGHKKSRTEGPGKF